MKNKKWLKVLLVLVIAAILGAAFSCQSNPDKDISDNSTENGSVEIITEPEEDSSEADSTSEAESTSEEICAYVCGAVKEPGVYYFEPGSRINDAVEAAGGFTDNAAKEYINLAEEIHDGQQIYIPDEGETHMGEFYNIDPGYDAPMNQSGDGLIDINTASLEQLKTLPGIGDVKANAIITYRETSGNFTDIEDIKNVSGIGESSFEKIKDYIKV